MSDKNSLKNTLLCEGLEFLIDLRIRLFYFSYFFIVIE